MLLSLSNMKLASIKENRVKNESILRPNFEQAKTSMNWGELVDTRKGRIKS